MSAAPHPPDAGVLYGRHRARVLAFCLSRLRSREEAEDAVQATFLYAFRAIERGVVPRHEAVWLIKIAENVCRSRRRTLLRRARVESFADVDLLEDSRRCSDRVDALEGLPEALASLPDRQRHALLLREWQGLSYREIAETLAVSESAVETLLFRARRSLAQRLQGARSLVDLGSLGALVRTLLSSTGGKAVAAAAAAGAASVAVTPALLHQVEQPPAAHPASRVTPRAATGVAAASRPAVVAVAAAAPAQHVASRARRRVRPHAAPPPVRVHVVARPAARRSPPPAAPSAASPPSSSPAAAPAAPRQSTPPASPPPPPAAPPSAPPAPSDPGGVVSGVTNALPTVDPPPVTVTVSVPTLPPVAGVTVPTPPPITVTTPDLPPLLP